LRRASCFSSAEVVPFEVERGAPNTLLGAHRWCLPSSRRASCRRAWGRGGGHRCAGRGRASTGGGYSL